MLNGLYSAATGMIAQQTRIDYLSNDIANVDTTGYKQVRLGFRDLVYNLERGMRVGAGAALVDGGRQFSEGSLQQTDSPFALAIDGPGFFQVRQANGQLALTRNGDFGIDASGQLVDGSGDRLSPPVNLPKGTSPGDVSISAAGVVRVKQTTVGQIDIYSVAAPSALQPVGSSLFVATAASGAAQRIAGSSIRQGFLEGSNVDLGDAMTNIIDAQRSYQLDSRVIQTQDQLMQIANEIRQ
jgi:flagellar basal-body rod protein FlgG